MHGPLHRAARPTWGKAGGKGLSTDFLDSAMVRAGEHASELTYGEVNKGSHGNEPGSQLLLQHPGGSTRPTRGLETSPRGRDETSTPRSSPHAPTRW
jgi:hypothetical protein